MLRFALLPAPHIFLGGKGYGSTFFLGMLGRTICARLCQRSLISCLSSASGQPRIVAVQVPEPHADRIWAWTNKTPRTDAMRALAYTSTACLHRAASKNSMHCERTSCAVTIDECQLCLQILCLELAPNTLSRQMLRFAGLPAPHIFLGGKGYGRKHFPSKHARSDHLC